MFASLKSLDLTFAKVYTYLVTNFGNTVELGNLVWSASSPKPHEKKFDLVFRSILVEVLFNVC